MKSLKTIITELFQLFKLTYKKIISNPQYWALILGPLLILATKIYFRSSSTKQHIPLNSLSQFFRKIQKGEISKALVKKNTTFFIDNKNILYKTYHSLFPKKELFDRLIKANVQFETIRSTSLSLFNFLTAFAVSALIVFLIKEFSPQIFKSNHKVSKKVNYNFQNIVGLDDCKVALREVIDFMKEPKKFNQLGARMRKGVIFYGPSGTGKTSLARACAGEANVPFFSCNAAEFREMYVGMGAKKIRQLFKTARKSAPSIVYIDQIDAMGNRNSGAFQNFDGAASQKNTTINQLLSQLDGFDSGEQILVIGSTNKLDLLDQALLRPGRFDLKIKVNLPSQKDRLQILNHYLKNKKHNLNEVYLKELVSRLKGWSGAHLQNFANEAVFTTLRRNNQIIQIEDMQKALKTLDN